MTRVFLAAGVAALAISAPASAQRDGEKKRERATEVKGDSGAQERVRADRPQRAERTQAVQRTERRAERPQRIERAQVDRQDRIQRVQADRQDR
ncbi:MAG: hypothetical protein ABIS39_02110, partial [Sphingomicrobium sp.]